MWTIGLGSLSLKNNQKANLWLGDLQEVMGLCFQILEMLGYFSKNKGDDSLNLGEILIFFFFFFCFLGPHPWHMVVPRLRVKSEPKLPAYAAAAATPHLSHICDLHQSSGNSSSVAH